MKITGRYARDVRRAKMISFMMSFLLCGGIGGLYIQPVFQKTDPIENSGRNVDKGRPIRDSEEDLQGNPPQKPDDSGVEEHRSTEDSADDAGDRARLKYKDKDSAKKKSYDEQVKIAVVIGIDDYGNHPKYGNLHGAEKDATDMAKFFAEQGYQKIYLFRSKLREKEYPTPKNRVYPRDIDEPTRGDFIDQMQKIAKNHPRIDRLAFYFAGHGKTTAETAKLITTKKNDSFSVADVIHQVRVLNETLQKKSESTIQDVLIIIDACEMGEKEIPADWDIKNSNIPNWLWAVSSTTIVNAKDTPKGGVFTQTLLEKYKTYDGGSSMLEKNNWIDAKEIRKLEDEPVFEHQEIVVNPKTPNHKKDFIIFKVTEGANE